MSLVYWEFSPLTIFSKRKKPDDNCIEENKNKTILVLLFYLVNVEQQFMVRGHSYLTCDRDLAQIERRKRIVKNMPSNI